MKHQLHLNMKHRQHLFLKDVPMPKRQNNLICKKPDHLILLQILVLSFFDINGKIFMIDQGFYSIQD